MDLSKFAEQLGYGTAKENKVYTTNEALVYGSAGDNLVELHTRATEFRNAPDVVIDEAIEKAYAENPVKAVKLIFQTADVREGKGERRFFNIALNDLAKNHPEMLKEVMPLIPEYTRWDHLTRLVASSNPFISREASNIVKEQFEKDRNSDSPSLLAKWMPSIQSKKTADRQLAIRLEKVLGLSHKDYRKALSEVRDKLNIIEKYLSCNDLDKIDMEKLTSKQQLRYSATLDRKLEARRLEYLQAVAEGRAKINASVLVPHEIVKDYRRYDSVNPALELLWKALPDKVQGNGDTMVIRDGSGSMTSRLSPSSRVTMLDIATALAVYTAQKLSGPLKGKFITFSAKPEIVDLSTKQTLFDALQHCDRYDDCTNTNIEKTFDLLLNVAKDNHLKQDEIPKHLLILSDMEFDGAMSSSIHSDGYYDRYNNLPDKETLFATIRHKWEEAGYELPTLVFWQLNAERTIYPEIDGNTIILSGFSTNTLDMVMRGEFEQLQEEVLREVNPETGNEEERVVYSSKTLSLSEQVDAILSNERYDAVEEAAMLGWEHEQERCSKFWEKEDADHDDSVDFDPGD